MKGFSANIEELSLENKNFRKVIYTAKNSQLVLMSLKPGQDIGMEIHPENDQFFRIEEGEGQCIIDSSSYELKDGSAIVVPAGARHNVINTGTKDLKLYTIYMPPHHEDGVVRSTKEEAEIDSPEFNGVTTE